MSPYMKYLPVSSVRLTGKFPEKVENLKRWARFLGWNFRTECRIPFTFLVVCTSSRSTVGHHDALGFTTKWNNFYQSEIPLFLPPKLPGFFPKWKAPFISSYIKVSPKLAPFLWNARFHGRLLPRFCRAAMSSLHKPSCQKRFPEIYLFLSAVCC